MSRRLTVERSTSTAHRLMHYDGVCSNVHGHNMFWEVELEVSMAGTGDDNMPVDFKTVSDMIDETDHAILLNEEDPLAGTEPIDAVDLLGDVITFDSDPTCEHISQWMADRLVDEIDPITHAEVTIYETDKYGMEASARGCTCGPNENCSSEHHN